MNSDEVKPRYAIDLKWYEGKGRSFITLARSHLCPSCQEKHTLGSSSASELLTAISDCCSQRDSFISPRLPLREAIFRLFLANGN